MILVRHIMLLQPAFYERLVWGGMICLHLTLRLWLYEVATRVRS